MKDISRRDFLKVMGGVAADAFLAKSGADQGAAETVGILSHSGHPWYNKEKGRSTGS